MDRRQFGMTMLGVATAARSAGAQALGQGPGQVPSWIQFKPRPGSIKEKMHAGQQIKTAGGRVDATRAELDAMIKKAGGLDLFTLDAQHTPLADERELTKFCKLCAELGVGVQLRIKHQKEAFLVGRYADLGVLAVMVPLVEDAETAMEAINNFYFPPLGNRSWGGNLMVGAAGFGGREKPPSWEERVKYAEWWNGHGLLGFQIETVRGALNARNIARPGLDWISRGSGDMAFDIERHSNTPFKTTDEVYGYIIDQLKGFDVRLPT